ncbi:FUSC family protein [Mycobacterium sp. MYCO198283]|uniref:FUSC family protein n=1 Tax=Mycobacterium sp. MYCO198283 TaxID=2883505 RepID=UPI001E3E5BD7|nr:FUSC family protein [Mycobacterium sp. MYCO198283]MCG5431062.1 FUSC family protein [Mycobacterium sp. MYCO198283]
MLRDRAAALASRAARRVRGSAWPILQQSLAAVLAWLIASAFATGHIPFFAPIAAVVALNARFGNRGEQALQLLTGVTVGILVGVEANRLIGDQAVALPLAVFAAMVCAAAVGGTRVTLAQSAASAVLTVVIPYGGAGGFSRLFDALIGVAVSLTFSQVLFPPHPLRLLRDAEAAALREMARGLDDAVAAMRGEAGAEGRALHTLREIRRELEDVGFAQTAGVNVSRRTLLWRHQRTLTVQESEVATQLQYLGPDCLTVTRVCLAVGDRYRELLASAVSAVADAFRLLADDPGAATVRSRAAHALTEAIARLRSAAGGGPARDDALSVAIAVVELLVVDSLIFCGVDPARNP